MPSFRDLDISVVCSPDDDALEALPELPHPDSSSHHLVSPHPISTASSPASSVQSTLGKRNPSTSVYIPSTPGAQFHIRYGIKTPPASTRYLYFRMSMNGRFVVGWGIESRAVSNQIVSHSLYEPDTKWQYREGGVTYKREGVEKRYFHFTPRSKQTSAAMDGGVIDLQVFRSKGRKKKAPELTEFRSQDQYGITSPTGGLLESPQDLIYYDWVLVDPLDSPYATFRFFYRTWGSLRALNLLPEAYYNELMVSKTQESNPPEIRQTSAESRSFGPGSLDGSVFEESSAATDKKNQTGQSSQALFHLLAPQKLEPPLATRSKMLQPSKVARDTRRDSDSQHPLPVPLDADTPLHKISLESFRAPSVTPSLQRYVDESSGAEEIELGVAKQIVLSSAHQEPSRTRAPVRPLPTPPTASSPSDYEMTPPSSGRAVVCNRAGLRDHTVTTGATREQQIEEYNTSESRVATYNTETVLATADFGNTSISEGEWLRRSPSPLRRKQGRANLANPGVHTRDESSEESSLGGREKG